MDRNFVELEIRRAFTAFQLLTTLEEAATPWSLWSTILRSTRMQREISEYISQAVIDLANRATVVLYAHRLTLFGGDVQEADRVFT